GGLNRLRNGHFEAFTRREGLPHLSVRALLPDPDGSVWIGTSGGLALFRDDHITAFDGTDGLTDADIGLILDDQLGCLWLGSNRGVFQVARAELEAAVQKRVARVRVTLYGRGDGLPSVQVSVGQPAGLRAHDGRLWFATLRGLSVVDPRRLRENPMPPPVAIEEIKIDGKPAVIPANGRSII